MIREDDEPTATGYDGFDVNGMDPTVDLLPAEVILSGRSAETIQADPRYGHLLATADDGQLLCLSLTDALRDALAAADRGSLHHVAQVWARIGRVPHAAGSTGPCGVPRAGHRPGGPGGRARASPLLLDLRLTGACPPCLASSAPGRRLRRGPSLAPAMETDAPRRQVEQGADGPTERNQHQHRVLRLQRLSGASRLRGQRAGRLVGAESEGAGPPDAGPRQLGRLPALLPCVPCP